MAARQAVKVRARRGARDVFIGVAATLALAALVAGVPLALWKAFGPPVPRVPSFDTLTEHIGPSSLIAILVALVWLAWLQLVVCVLVELQAGVRGVGVPARVPLAGGTQALVHRLVASALLLFTATTVVVPALTPRPAGAAATAAQTPAPAVRLETHQYDLTAAVTPRQDITAPVADEPAAQPMAKSEAKKIYRVQPPHGRHHESLWEIAEKCLGEGRRYGEIFELNKGRSQPDGSRLTIASLIRPGWVLEMPDDAVGTQVVPAHHLDDYFRDGKAPADRPMPEEPPAEPPVLETPADEPAVAEPPAAEFPDEPPAEELPDEPPAAEFPGEPPAAELPDEPPAAEPPVEPPAAEAPAAPGPAPDSTPTRRPAPHNPASQSAAPHGPATEGPVTEKPVITGPVAQVSEPGAFDLGWEQGLAAGSLLAAGLLVALRANRRRQMWHRPGGRAIARPEGIASVAEQALQIGADHEGTRLLDIALRHLSKALAADGRTLPTVYGVHLGRTSLDLWLAPADGAPPAPWEAYDGGQVWRLHTDAFDTIDTEGLADVLAPYPGLISIGTNDTGRILVDLEAAHGLISVSGPEEHRRAALAAMAVELATNRWSDHMRLTLVGFGDELGLLAPDRIRTAASLAEALPELESRAEEVRQALAASGVDSVLTGRCRGVFGEAWMPHYLIMADEPTPEEAARLAALARTGRRMAAGYVVAGEVQAATWSWEITREGRLRAGVLGFDVAAQLLPERQYEAVVELFRTAGRLDGTPLPEPGPADPPPGHGTDQGAVVDVRLLGPTEVDAPGPMDDGRRALCTEVLVYLATHPGGVHPTVLAGAVWPRGVTAGVRDATVARVSDWLGRDSRGRPNLYYDERGRIRLGSEVRIDWGGFRWSLWRSAAEPASETAYMAYALDLVRGPLLADRPAGRYAWLAREDLEYEAAARIIEVAHRLVVLRLDDGDARGAMAAARAGLRFAPDDQGLWRDLLRATHAAEPGWVPEVVAELHDLVDHDLSFERLRPETEALIEEFLPHYRQVSLRGA